MAAHGCNAHGCADARAVDGAGILLRSGGFEVQMRIGARVTIGLALLWGSAAACFTGAERDKDPPPGVPGGKCLAPDPAVGGSMPTCSAGTCNLGKNYCYDTTDPCRGFFCGGEDRGTCMVDANAQPACICNPGFNNDVYSHYCCPDDGSEPTCAAMTVSDGGEESGSSSGA
jgi:hypothetical protein